MNYGGMPTRGQSNLDEPVDLSANPMGDPGAEALAKNTSLLHLILVSYRLKSKGAILILQALAGHPRLMKLYLGRRYATEDIGMRYND